MEKAIMNQNQIEAASNGMMISTTAIKITMPGAVPHLTTPLDLATPTLIYAISAQGGRQSQLAMRKRLAASGIRIGRGRTERFLTEYMVDQGYLMQTHAFVDEIALIIGEDRMNGITVHCMIDDPSGTRWMIGIAMDRGDPKPTVLKVRAPD